MREGNVTTNEMNSGFGHDSALVRLYRAGDVTTKIRQTLHNLVYTC